MRNCTSKKKNQRLQSTPTTTQVKDAITCSIEREDDWKGKRKRKLFEILSRRRKKERQGVAFLLKEKKKGTYQGLGPKKKPLFSWKKEEETSFPVLWVYQNVKDF